MKKIIRLFLGILILQSCQIREEISFKEDGSGSYEMTFDMSEFMKMDDVSDSLPPDPPIDTLINFASFLDQKRDSISKLSKEDQLKLEALRPLEFSMKANDSLKQMEMHLIYNFIELDDIVKFAKIVKTANIKELNELSNSMNGSGVEADTETEDTSGVGNDLFSIAESFQTTFTRAGFSRKITEVALQDALMKKDTSLTSDDPFSDIIRFKQVYRFPYKIKNVSNANARILPNFKGVEIEANMFEMNNDPEYFNVEVEFEQ